MGIETWILLGGACVMIALGGAMVTVGMRSYTRMIDEAIRTGKRLEAQRKRLIENPPRSSR